LLVITYLAKTISPHAESIPATIYTTIAAPDDVRRQPQAEPSTSKLSVELVSYDGTFALEFPYFFLPMNFPTRPFRAAVVSSSGALGLRLSVV
jgi:hypothetical protein